MTKKNKINEYRFLLYSLVCYKGKLFEEYHSKTGKIIKRTRRRGKHFYVVQFMDGKCFTFQENILDGLPIEGQISFF